MGRMISLLFGLCVCLFALSGVFSAQVGAGDVAQLAQEAYERGDYEEAIALYETLINAGVEDVAVYFNLGNAHYEIGQLGWAMVYYLKAHHLTPRNDAINQQIARIRSERVDFFGEETDILTLIGTATNGIMTQGELETVTLLVWISWFSGACVWLWRPMWRKNLLGGLILLGGVLILLVGLFISREYVSARRPLAVIVPSSVDIMSGAGDEYLDLYRLFSATEIRVISEDDGWIRFHLPNGRQGWVPREAIVMIEE